jgi:hypothetical protein
MGISRRREVLNDIRNVFFALFYSEPGIIIMGSSAEALPVASPPSGPPHPTGQLGITHQRQPYEDSAAVRD